MGLTSGDWPSWIAAVAALLAIGFGLFEKRSADRAQRANQLLAEENGRLAARQHQLEVRAWADGHFEAVRDWANQVCHTIAEAIHLVDEDASELARRSEVLSKLSALIDTGRWYFPNQWSDEVGVHKEPAYRGLRQPVLDCVVAAYREVASVQDNHLAKRQNLTAHQREFVSYIQETLDPRQRNEEIKRRLSEFEQSKRLRSAQKEVVS